MRKFLSVLIIVISVIAGVYVGGFLMFIQPILDVCQNFDNGTLTGTMVGIAVLKCIFASFVGFLIYFVGIVIGKGIDK